MHRIAAALLALSVTQQDPPAPPAPPPVAQEGAEPRAAARAPESAPPVAEPPPDPAAPPGPAAPTPPPAPRPPSPSPPPAPGPVAPAPQPRAPPPPPPPPVVAPKAPAAAPPPIVAPPPARPAPAPVPQGSERDRLLQAALTFLDALLRADAVALASGSAQRFSFDGTPIDGHDAQAHRWREILSVRGGGRGEVLRDLVLFTAEEAQAQLGPPPARMATLLKPGTWVAVADVSSRPVVLFLVKEGDRFTVAGMQD